MASYSQRDQQMLTEAYTLQLLKESIPDMTLSQVHANLNLMSESELEYVNTVMGRLNEGFFGNVKAGLKGVAKGVGQTAGNVASNVAQTASNVGSNVAQTARNVGSNVAGVARGVGQAGAQVAQNASDMYTTGRDASKQTDILAQATKSIEELSSYLRQAEESGLIGVARGQTMNMSLNNIITKLEKAQQQAGSNAQASQSGGLGAGIGQAYQQGRQG
jgi:hypothetical protein